MSSCSFGRQSMCRRASAGRSRAARRPPTDAGDQARRAARARSPARRGRASTGAFERDVGRAGDDLALAEARRPPRPAGPARPPAPRTPTDAWSVRPSALTSAAPPIPSDRRRRTPPSAPCTSDSPLTWRTTLRCGQPIAFSVPSSRMRLVTDDSVSSIAIRNDAASATIASAVPSLLARFLASTSEPPTRSARSFAVVTDAPSSVFSISPTRRRPARVGPPAPTRC